MKVLLDIKDEKAPYLMEVLKGLSFVKTVTISESKAKSLQGLKDSIEQVNSDKLGKIKLKSINTLLIENVR